MFLNDAFELLNGWTADPVIRRMSLALNNDQTICMNRKAIDTEVVRLSRRPSLKAGTRKKAHGVPPISGSAASVAGNAIFIDHGRFDFR